MSKKATNFLSKKATHCLLSCFFACVALLLSKFLLSKKATQAKKQQQQSNNAKKQCRVPSKEATKQKSNTKSSAKKQQPAKKQQTFRAKKQHEQKSNSNESKKATSNFAIEQFRNQQNLLRVAPCWRVFFQRHLWPKCWLCKYCRKLWM